MHKNKISKNSKICTSSGNYFQEYFFLMQKITIEKATITIINCLIQIIFFIFISLLYFSYHTRERHGNTICCDKNNKDKETRLFYNSTCLFACFTHPYSLSIAKWDSLQCFFPIAKWDILPPS